MKSGGRLPDTPFVVNERNDFSHINPLVDSVWTRSVELILIAEGCSPPEVPSSFPWLSA